jgi:hypothetical protein
MRNVYPKYFLHKTLLLLDIYTINIIVSVKFCFVFCDFQTSYPNKTKTKTHSITSWKVCTSNQTGRSERGASWSCNPFVQDFVSILVTLAKYKSRVTDPLWRQRDPATYRRLLRQSYVPETWPLYRSHQKSWCIGCHVNRKFKRYFEPGYQNRQLSTFQGNRPKWYHLCS